jgi:hypothetical protein
VYSYVNARVGVGMFVVSKTARRCDPCGGPLVVLPDESNSSLQGQRRCRLSGAKTTPLNDGGGEIMLEDVSV